MVSLYNNNNMPVPVCLSICSLKSLAYDALNPHWSHFRHLVSAKYMCYILVLTNCTPLDDDYLLSSFQTGWIFFFFNLMHLHSVPQDYYHIIITVIFIVEAATLALSRIASICDSQNTHALILTYSWSCCKIWTVEWKAQINMWQCLT